MNPIISAFLGMVDTQPPDSCMRTPECWRWLGMGEGLKHDWRHKQPRRGYGKWRSPLGKIVSAHRFMYEITKGAIPTGWEIDHTCHDSLCVNPDHLEAVTREENQARFHKSCKLYCAQGHYKTAKSWQTKGRQRICKPCRQAQKRRRLIAARLERASVS